MDGIELSNWRKRYKVTQAELAKHLGVDRKTVNRWENLKTPMPVDIYSRLPVHGVTKPLEERVVCIGMKDRRSDLRLYTHLGGGPQWFADIEHPRRILYERKLNVCPIELLEDPEYLRRVELQRKGKWKVPNMSRAEVDPSSIPPPPPLDL